MKKVNLNTCQLTLFIFPDIILVNTTIHENVFLKALTYTSELKISNLNIDNDTFQLDRILLINKHGNLIIINENKIIVRNKNIVNILDDPDFKLLSFIIRQISNDYFDEIKYFLDVGRNKI